MNKKIMRILLVLLISITFLSTNIYAYADGNYTWTISYTDLNTKDGKIGLTIKLKLKNNTQTTNLITVTEGTNDFYIEDNLIDNFTWNYSGLGGTEEEPEIIYERIISTDYVYTWAPTIQISTETNNSTSYKTGFSFKSSSKNVQLKNIISTIPTSALDNNPWEWSPTITFYDRIIGYSYVTDTNPENYDISKMNKSLDQWTSGSVTLTFYPTNAEKYLHITFYTYGGSKASYVYQIPSASTLTYDTGESDTIDNITVFTGGQVVVTSTVPSKEGYTFNGWYTGIDGTGTKYEAGDQITLTQDLTLYALFTANESTLTVNPNGGIWAGSTKQLNITGSYNDTIQIPIPIKEGYTFTGWTRTNTYGTLSSLTENATYTFGKAANVTDTITANYELTDYTIETNYLGSGAISNSSKVTYKEDTSIFIIPAKGYSLTTLKIDNIDVTPVESYNFLNVEKDHKIEATFTITQTRKMELLKNAYSWIDLKLT